MISPGWLLIREGRRSSASTDTVHQRASYHWKYDVTHAGCKPVNTKNMAQESVNGIMFSDCPKTDVFI